MKVRQIIALVVSAACVAGGSPPLRAATGAVATHDQNPQTVPQPSATSALTISGTVVRDDRKTPVADERLQLRNINTGAIVGRTVSDKNGAFSFAVSEPGLYVVEALRDDGAVVAVGDLITLTKSSLSTLVILPSYAAAAIVVTTALLVLAAAASADIIALRSPGPAPTTNGNSVESPER